MTTYSAARAAVATSAAALLLLTGATSTAAAPGSGWSASGPGTVTVLDDGTSGPPSFSYDLSPAGFADRSWTFSTTSAQGGPLTVNWSYEGFHAYFQVRAGLSAFVTDASGTTTQTLLAAGPANCCTTPSNGFSYSGTAVLPVTAGSTYGFTATGRNFDSTNVLRGTLVLHPVATDKEQCKDEGWRGLFTADDAPFRNQGQCVSYVVSER